MLRYDKLAEKRRTQEMPGTLLISPQFICCHRHRYTRNKHQNMYVYVYGSRSRKWNNSCWFWTTCEHPSAATSSAATCSIL